MRGPQPRSPLLPGLFALALVTAYVIVLLAAERQAVIIALLALILRVTPPALAATLHSPIVSQALWLSLRTSIISALVDTVTRLVGLVGPGRSIGGE